MACPQQEQLTPKQQVLRDLEAARASLAHHATQAAEEWSPRALVSRSFAKHRSLWIGGAALVGLVLTRLFRPAGNADSHRDNLSSLAKDRGLFALLLGPILSLSRKTLLDYAAQLFESFLRQKISPNDPDAGTV
jgi:sensor c-di-GMP phosphodiesterase-like protein